MRLLLSFVWAHAAVPRLLGCLQSARPASVCTTRRGLSPPQPAQGLQGDQRAGEEQRRAVHVADKQQEAEGDHVPLLGQLSRPGLGDAEKSEKSCQRHESNLDFSVYLGF